MFSKVLVAEDVGSIGKGVVETLKSMGIENIDIVQYCDDAFLRIKRAIVDKEPFELFITDLSFQPDHRKTTIKSGEDLLEKIANEPDLKTIVYSIDSRLHKARFLVDHCNVNAYVCKGRRGLVDLKKAIESVHAGDRFFSEEVMKALSGKDRLEIDDFDLELLRLLAQGYSKDEVSDVFKKKDMAPASRSSIEKRQARLLVIFNAKNATQLIGIVKDMGLI